MALISSSLIVSTCAKSRSFSAFALATSSAAFAPAFEISSVAWRLKQSEEPTAHRRLAVLPPLRQTLMQLIVELQYQSDMSAKEVIPLLAA